MKKQSKKQQIEEFTRWKNSTYGTNVWVKDLFSDNEWYLMDFPEWTEDAFYIVDDIEVSE